MIVRPEFQAEQGTHAAGTQQLVLERLLPVLRGSNSTQ